MVKDAVSTTKASQITIIKVTGSHRDEKLSRPGYQSSPAKKVQGRARTTPIGPMALQTSDRVARGPSARGLAAGTTVGSDACA
jgi:hypothetical protein